MNESHASAGTADRAGGPAQNPDDELVAAESLIEEVSIDGMCGVY
jgi:mycofactocin precursor